MRNGALWVSLNDTLERILSRAVREGMQKRDAAVELRLNGVCARSGKVYFAQALRCGVFMPLLA
jgi:hypothetical protein